MNIFSQNISPFRRAELPFSHVRDNPVAEEHLFHLHDFTEIFICVSGDVDFLVSDNYIPMEPGDILILKKNVLHKAIIKSNALYERFYLGVPDGILAGMDRVEDPLGFLQQAETLLKPGKVLGEQICRLCQQIHNAIEWEQPGQEYLCFSYVLQIFQLLQLASSSQVSLPREGRSGSPLIRQILQYINENVGEIAGVKELAEHFGVNPSYLSGLFSREMNVPLKQYLTVRKISLARELLAGGESVSGTAYLCGFSSASHFIAAFRRITGVTPRAYQLNLAGISSETGRESSR